MGPQILYAWPTVGVSASSTAAIAASTAASSAANLAAQRRRQERDRHQQECAQLGCAPDPQPPTEPWGATDYGFVLLLTAMILGFLGFMFDRMMKHI